MAKNKNDRKTYLDQLWKEIESQERRVKETISKFYPNDELAEFVAIPQVAKSMRDYPKPIGFTPSSDYDGSQWDTIVKNTMKKHTMAIGIDVLHSAMHFQNASYDVKACVMFKTAPEDKPTYMLVDWEEWKGTAMRFLVDCDLKEAFVVLGDADQLHLRESAFSRLNPEQMRDFSSFNSTVSLEELHAIIFGYNHDAYYIPDSDEDYDDDHHFDNPEFFMVSFSKKDGRFVVEKILDFNTCLTHKLLQFGEYGGLSNKTTSPTQSEAVETTAADDSNEVVETTVVGESNE